MAASVLASLFLATCDVTSPLQRNFSFEGGVVRYGGGCVTFDLSLGYNAPLQVSAPCASGSAAQSWVFDAAGGSISNAAPLCGGEGGACIQWSGQEYGNCTTTPPSLGVNCIVGTWPTSTPTTWNNAFSADAPSPGMIQVQFSSGGEAPSPPGLCVAAVPPPAPPTPNADILAWSRDEVMCLYDFDMCTMVGSQGCDCGAAPPGVDAWAPTALDTDSWLAAGVAAGCKTHILVAKHMCGFVTWNSSVGAELGYNYSSAYAASGVDVVAPFADSVRAAGGKLGLYYSLTNNARTNTCAGSILPDPAPGQVAVTVDEYDALVLGHLAELWGNYGVLEEIWFDGGSTPGLTAAIPPLMARLQPHAIAFNGAGLCPSPSRWIGSESGFAPYPTWSTCDYAVGQGAGSPDSADWFPAETDFTVLSGDTWFFDPTVPVRPPSQLRAMYEASVGHNTQALIGVGIPPNGTLVGTAQAASLVSLGAYISNCYGNPVATMSGTGYVLRLLPSAAVTIDRALVSEDQSTGQLVRAWTITATLANGTNVLIDQGPSIGNKKISVLAQEVGPVVLLTLNISAAVGVPKIAAFSVFSGCNALASRLG